MLTQCTVNSTRTLPLGVGQVWGKSGEGGAGAGARWGGHPMGARSAPLAPYILYPWRCPGLPLLLSRHPCRTPRAQTGPVPVSRPPSHMPRAVGCTLTGVLHPKAHEAGHRLQT